jgi:hypothetical protein
MYYNNLNYLRLNLIAVYSYSKININIFRLYLPSLLVEAQALVSSQKYARYVPKIPQGRTHSYYPCHFNRYFPCQNVDRTQIAY